ncbi:hypothetical protein HanIR_Chr11g0541941 [Helianthus annuus]|nr:hypothetical protein HanIR_Chr11g0541941 [Helianthus annuus]
MAKFQTILTIQNYMVIRPNYIIQNISMFVQSIPWCVNAMYIAYLRIIDWNY